jgi:hypothetical protein
MVSFAILCLPVLLSGQNTPCECAERWEDGASWNPDGTVNDNPGNGDIKGIVECGSQANTQSNIMSNCTYDSTAFKIDTSVFPDCIDPSDGSVVSVDPPTQGEPLLWFNFDVRAFAGSFQVQINDNAGDNIGWALYKSTDNQAGTDTDPSDSNNNELSGDCSSFEPVAGAPVPVACGSESSNTWNTLPIESEFTEPSNYYLVVWDQDADGELTLNNFKARRGCGDADIVLCALDTITPMVSTTCDNANGTYNVEIEIMGVNGEYVGFDPNATPTTSAPICLTNLGEQNPEISGTIVMTYPQSVGNYNVTISAQSPPSGNCADPVNADDCEIMVSGLAPDCCNLSCTASGTNESCDGNNDGTATANPVNGTNPLTYLWDDAGAQTTVTATGLSAGTYTVIVTDANTCTSSCTVSIGIDDITPPSITCPSNLTLECGAELDETLNTTISNWLNSAVTSDAGGPVSVTTNYSSTGYSNGCGATGNQTVIFTATDNCDLTATCQAIIIIEDTTPPTVSCPSDTTIECGGDTSPTSNGSATGNDDCGGVSITFTDVSVPGCGNTEIISRTWTATDDCGLTSFCFQTITVEDTTPPTVNCPADTTVECGGDTSPTSNGSATGSDGCGAVIITFTDVSVPGCGNTEVISRTWTATDDCGLTSFCIQTITVEDTTPPTVSCPSDTTVECGGDTSPASNGSATGSDGCGGVSITFSDVSVPGCGNTEIITRTWTATDDCGLTSSCNQTITVVDTTPPTVSCPSDTTVECGGDTSPTSNGSATGSDGCGGVVITFSDISVSSCGNTEVITRTWTATDDCGLTSSCAQSITVEDSNPPTINCPSDTTVECGGDTSPTSNGSATSSDGCGGVVITFSDVSVPGCGNTEIITRTWTATDNCGLTLSCTQTITVVDTTPPTVSCPSDTTVECGGDTSPTSNGSATGSDGCGGVAITFSDVSVPGCGNTEIITRTWTATDDCGLTSSCTQTITVVDTTPPTVSCPSDTTVECGGDTSPTSNGSATGSDGCGGVAITFSDVSVPGCGNTEIVTRTWTATDDCGLTSSCTQTITVVDTTPPTVSCPSDVTVECGGDTSPTSNGTATGSDGCGGVAITFTDVIVPACGNTEIITRTWTVTDDCGLTSNCIQTITVVDTTPPTISCPSDTTVECEGDTSPTSNGSATGNDGCGGVAITFTDVSVPACGNTEIITRTWTATDDCGLTSTCSQTITVQDNTPPEIVCPPDVSVECDLSTSPDDTGVATGSDGCGGVSITFLDDIVPQGCPDSEVITRTWTVTDDCGNSNTCTQTITIQVPEIDVSKIVSVEPVSIGNGVYSLYYEITVTNSGETVLNNIQLQDDMSTTFALAVNFNVNSYSITTQPANTTLTTNNGYNGGPGDINVLDGNGTLLPGEFAIITIQMIVTPGEFLGPYLNTAIGTGICPSGSEVMDESDAGTETGPTEVEFPPLNELSDFVWHDINGDGIQQPGEPGINGVVLNLYDDMGNFIRDTFTANGGIYIFDELDDGNYYIEIIPPGDYEVTFPNEGGNPDIDSDIDDSNGPNTSAVVTLSNGQIVNNFDIGLFVCVGIGELVWYDTTLDDLWNDFENGINGLTVNLYRNHGGSWILFDTDITGHKPGTPSDDGYYKFCAPPGEYYLEVPIAPEYELVPVLAFEGTDPTIDSDYDGSNGPFTTPTYTFTSGEEDCTISAGFYPMALMGDRIWEDINVNGMQDNGEPFMSGVVIEAYDVDDNLIGSDVSNNQGQFIIDYLQKKEYYLKVYSPEGYGFTTPNEGTDDEMDSDVDGSNGQSTTPLFLLDPGVELLSVDAGFVEGALPLNLISFTGENSGKRNILYWKTNDEINVDKFEIERKSDLTTFNAIGSQITGTISAGTNDYSFTDTNIFSEERYYYRLKMIDLDGSFEYSHVIVLESSKKGEFKASVHPNPSDGKFNLVVENPISEKLLLNIYDVSNSQLIKSERIDIPFGTLETTINKDFGWLTPGVYILEIKSEEKITRKKILIIK